MFGLVWQCYHGVSLGSILELLAIYMRYCELDKGIYLVNLYINVFVNKSLCPTVVGNMAPVEFLGCHIRTMLYSC